jgi:hypothetical protein
MSRSCNGCTKCCEGWLGTTVEGHEIYRGVPCPFLVINKGCSRHKTRPVDPCRTFQCAWITNPDIPVWLKPDAANVIMMEREIEGNSYILMVAAGAPISSSLLSWFVTWGIQNYGNVAWETELGSHFHLGSPDFGAAMTKKLAFNKKALI